MPDNFNNIALIDRDESLLVVIDIQERLMPVIADRERVIENVLKLVQFSKIVGLPVVLTEQERLGSTLNEVKKELHDLEPVVKKHFNCFYDDIFSEKVRGSGKKTLIIAGVEAHICVAQTAIYASSRFNVHVIEDAVSSRTRDNRGFAIERMKQAGVVISSTEMFIYEILKMAGTAEFKEALKLVK